MENKDNITNSKEMSINQNNQNVEKNMKNQHKKLEDKLAVTKLLIRKIKSNQLKNPK